MVTLENGKVIHFGQKGYADFLQHHDEERKKRYLSRHKKHENWNASGIDTAGWWARFLLWELPNIDDAIHNIEEKFNIEIVSNI